MGNTITYKARPDLDAIDMSNGLTAVVMSALVLAASELAASDRQRAFAVWFAEHDQWIFGLGGVGFDIGDMPWSSVHLADDRAFMLRVIDAAKARTGWQRLGYTPREEWVQLCLTRLRLLVETFDAAHISPLAAEWLLEAPQMFALCTIHRAYCHEYGCLLCHDQ